MNQTRIDVMINFKANIYFYFFNLEIFLKTSDIVFTI